MGKHQTNKILRQERVAAIIDMVIEQGSVTIEELVDQMKVSPATIRRDVEYLADQQLLTRTRGGVIANTSSGELPLRYRAGAHSEEKSRIALHAARLVQPGDVIAFNGGTTTTQVAYEVGIRTEADQRFEDEGLTLVTNAVNIANDLIVRKRLTVVVLGGVALNRSYELIGPLANLMLPHIAIDTLFLGVNAFDINQGLYCPNEAEADINASLVKIAKRTIVVTDARKFSATAFAKICDVTDIDHVITDKSLSKQHQQNLEAHNIPYDLV